MEWSIFAVLQMFIITVAVSTALWLRMRAVNQQNEQLREHIETHKNQTVTEQTSPEAWLEEKIQNLPEEAPLSPLLKVVLAHQLNPNSDLETALKDAWSSTGLAAENTDGETSEEAQAQIDALQAELDSLRDSAATGGEGERTEELKALLQQFTRDSREMMACIQTLEKENAVLREQLGMEAEAADEPTITTENRTAQTTENAA